MAPASDRDDSARPRHDAKPRCVMAELISSDDNDDAKVETILRDYLSSRLDGQLGRAAAHFHRHLGGHDTGTSSPDAGPSTRRRHYYKPGGGGWVIGIVGSAL